MLDAVSSENKWCKLRCYCSKNREKRGKSLRVILKSILFILIALIVVNELLSWKFTTNRSLSLPKNLISTAVKYRHEDNYLKRPFLDIRNDHISYVTDNRNRALREYTTEDVVRCLDSMAEQRNWRPIHIAFIGDSTIRQHFFSFLQRVPDYDREMVHSIAKSGVYHFHEDRNVTSWLLHDLRVSFYWRNVIKDDLIADFKRWASTNDDSHVPDFILLGITAHHVSRTNVNSSLEMYETLMERDLMPLINQSLTVHPHLEIVWLRQSPTGADRFSREIDAETIIMYNKVIHRIFRDTRIVIWDSVNAVVEEYLRGCALARYDRRDPSRYVNCHDTIHPGMAALSIGTQLIINHICESLNQ